MPPAKCELHTIRCDFCETEFHPPEPKPAPGPKIIIRESSTSKASADQELGWGCGLGVVLLVAAIGGASHYFSQKEYEAEMNAAQQAVEEQSQRLTERTQDRIAALVFWWSRYVPQFGEVNGETVIVGSVRRQSGGSYIVAINTAGEERWSVGPMDPEDDFFRAHSFVSGQQVLTANSDHELQVLSLDTGEVTHTFPARSDEIKGFCQDEDGSPLIKVMVSDKNHVQVNLEDNSIQALNKGASKECETRNDHWRKQLKRMPKPKNTAIEHARFSSDGLRGVGGGYKSPGTRIPRIWGWSTKTGEITWSRDLGDAKKVDPWSDNWGIMLGQTYITHFEADDVQTLIALNPTDGESLWETPIYENENATPNIDTPEQFVGIGHSLVVTSGSGIWIFDTNTGERTGFYGAP